jgi:hypothetical protein
MIPSASESESRFRDIKIARESNPSDAIQREEPVLLQKRTENTMLRNVAGEQADKINEAAAESLLMCQDTSH